MLNKANILDKAQVLIQIIILRIINPTVINIPRVPNNKLNNLHPAITIILQQDGKVLY